MKLDFLKDVVFIADEVGDIIFSNEKAKKDFGDIKNIGNILEDFKEFSETKKSVIIGGNKYFVFSSLNLKKRFFVFKKSIFSFDNNGIEDFIHEIRNPLLVLQSGAEAFLLPGLSSKDKKLIEKKIGLASSKLNNLLLDFNFFLKNEKPKFKQCEIGKVLLDSRDLVLSMYKNCKIELFLPDKKIEGFINSNLLGIVFRNLFENGIKFSDGKLDVFLEKEDNKVKIRVRDKGIGIKSDALNNLFSRGFKGDKGSNGSGIGLFLVKKIIDFHDGKVDFFSKEGKGSLVEIEIPAC